jgi:hypothetical protein
MPNASLLPWPKIQFSDASGSPLSGGKLYSYISGTVTPLATYTDSTGVTANSNPVLLDSAGMASVWLGPSVYKFVLQNSAGAQIWSVDGIQGNGIFNGYLSLTEQSAPTGAASTDQLWADSTAHRLKMINNNGAADPVVGQATTDTLTNKTLTSPTITSPTTTGTDAGAETLQNKTLTGAGSGNSVTLLNVQGPASAITGTAADATVYTYTIPANTIGAGKGFRLKVTFIHSTGTASVTYKLSLGGTLLDSAAYSNINTGAVDQFTWEIFNNSGVQNAQNWVRGATQNNNAGGAVQLIAANSVGTSAKDMTASQILLFTFNVAATDQVTPKQWVVELIQ